MTHKPGDRLDATGTVLVDALGAAPVEMQPTGQTAIMLDLAGRVNKTRQRHEKRYAMTPKITAELIVDLAYAIRSCGPEEAAEVIAELDRLWKQRVAAEKSP